jgi:pimeloyl-ACP methyl ester carboxylesterase
LRDYRIQLPDGRLLGYAESGAPAGRAVLYFHGHPGARLEAGFLADPATRANVRLIGVDRPGMGLSTYQPGRRLLDWPADIAALADALAIERFAVVGLSGGGPYALACATRSGTASSRAAWCRERYARASFCRFWQRGCRGSCCLLCAGASFQMRLGRKRP